MVSLPTPEQCIPQLCFRRLRVAFISEQESPGHIIPLKFISCGKKRNTQTSNAYISLGERRGFTRSSLFILRSSASTCWCNAGSAFCASRDIRDMWRLRLWGSPCPRSREAAIKMAFEVFDDVATFWWAHPFTEHRPVCFLCSYRRENVLRCLKCFFQVFHYRFGDHTFTMDDLVAWWSRVEVDSWRSLQFNSARLQCWSRCSSCFFPTCFFYQYFVSRLLFGSIHDISWVWFDSLVKLCFATWFDLVWFGLSGLVKSELRWSCISANAKRANQSAHVVSPFKTRRTVWSFSASCRFFSFRRLKLIFDDLVFRRLESLVLVDQPCVYCHVGCVLFLPSSDSAYDRSKNGHCMSNCFFCRQIFF